MKRLLWGLAILSALLAISDCLHYKGCYVYTDSPNLVNIPLLYGKNLSQSLTPQLCHDHCLKYNMPWAALQGGSQCWCSNSIQDESKVFDKECNKKCSGDLSLVCGGIERMTIYKVDETPNYVGCFQDNETRIMGNRMAHYQAMTPDICVRHCRDQGALYAGTEAGTECWCSTFPPPEAVRLDYFDCDNECHGDTSKVCGGQWRLSVLKVDDAAKYVGCYETHNRGQLITSGDAIVVSSLPGKLSPNSCIELCRQLYMAIAGLIGQDCRCLHKLPSYTKLANETDCNRPCEGDNSQLCGGFSRISTYQILDVAPYIGCYKDGGTASARTLPTGLTSWGKFLTPELCILHCKNLNKLYAGLQAGTWCTCGDRLAVSRAPELQCGDECSGRPTKKCGGGWRNSIYSIGGVREDISVFNMGCFKETTATLNQWEVTWDFPKHLTPELCMGHCWRNSYTYAGVRDGDVCVCGNDIQRRVRVSDVECSLTCPGDRNSWCGHQLRTNIYLTSAEGKRNENKPNENYLGCFKYPDSELIQTITFQEPLESNCINFCLLQGFKLAGFHLLTGNNCTCFDVVKRQERLEENHCIIPCIKDSKEKCEDQKVLRVFKTGLVDVNIDGKLLGCFPDSLDNKNQLLPEAHWDLLSNTPQRCMNLCFNKGYSYSGVKNGFECQCGNTGPDTRFMLTEYDCWDSHCPGNAKLDCGGKKKIVVHSTGLKKEGGGFVIIATQLNQESCSLPLRSVTRMNGRYPCRGEILLIEDFKEYPNLTVWNRHNYMPRDRDHEFVMFTNNPENSYVKDNALYIKPTIQNNDFVREPISLDGCTGLAGTDECEREPFSHQINPPIASALLSTKLSFRQGRIDITAKLPSGNWIWPELRLTSANKNKKGYIKLALVRGNSHIIVDNTDIGSTMLEAGVASSSDDGEIKQKIVQWTQSKDWTSEPHNFTTIWTATQISFLVDDSRIQTIDLNSHEFKKRDCQKCINGDFLNEELHLSVGVSVGGVTEFPDRSSGSSPKPWENGKVKAVSKFYESRHLWYNTWQEEESALKIYSIVIRAL